MLKTFAALGALVLIMSVAPLNTADARNPTEYDRCMISAVSDCYPIGPVGPYLPAPGSPEEDVYNQCVADSQALCVGLPGDPNG